LAVPDVDQVGRIEPDQEHHVVALLSESLALRHARRVKRDAESELREEIVEEAVTLVTEASPFLANDLGVGRLGSERDLSPEMNVQIFERNAEQKGTLKCAKRLEARLERSAIADSLQRPSDV
jgi:hypothetical protein